jgi:hypothetical protein
MKIIKRVFLLFLGLALGVGLGLLIGWLLWPVRYTNTALDQLHPAYKEEYIRMVAMAYQVDGDLSRARDDLAALNPTEPHVPLVTLTEKLIARRAAPHVILPLAHLSKDLNALTPAMEPYLRGGSP